MLGGRCSNPPKKGTHRQNDLSLDHCNLKLASNTWDALCREKTWELNKMTCFLFTITIYFHLQNNRSEKCHIINARGGGREVAGACGRRGACRGGNSHKNTDNCPGRYPNTFGGNWWQRVTFVLKYLLMKTKLGSSKKGTFLIQSKRGGAWAALGVCLCTCLDKSIFASAWRLLLPL